MSLSMPPPSPKKSNITHVLLLVDSSGSMNGLEEATVNQLNSVVAGFKKSAKETKQEVVLSLYTFGHRIDQLSHSIAIEQVPEFTRREYVADGNCTKMYDALGKAINYASNCKIGPGFAVPDANLVTVITDGQANGDYDFNERTINELIEKLQSTDRWTFSFLMPKGGRNYIRALTAVHPGNITEWETTKKGVEAATASLVNSYSSYLDLRSTGKTSTKGFFTAQVDAKQAAQAKKKLDDVRSEFKVMNVRTQDPKVIQEFVEARGLTFQKGKAFYQLTKPETVHYHKEVLLKDLATGSIYGGAQARDILGLPKTDVKVKPADHGDWDIFVQSTSNNRKLVNGTTVLYLK